ncbi:flagella basal body P-ring formation protein FlgA [Sinorhizobium fredii]
MMFRRSAARVAVESRKARFMRSLASAAIAAALLSPGLAAAQQPTAVIPKQTIYPGETIEASMLEVVDVTNPDITDGYVGVA